VRYPEAVPRARQAGWLMVAAGLVTVANNYLPGSEQLDVAVLNLVGVTAIALGLVARLLPWHRWPGAVTLVFAPVAFVLIAVANRFGGVSHFSYGVYFVLTFTWVGLSFPPRTSFLLAPLAIVAYVLPGLTTVNGPAGSVSSVTVVIPVSLLVAETIARGLQKMTAATAASRQQETALQEAEERFRLAFTNAPIGMSLTSLEGRFLQVNDALAQMLGRSPDLLAGTTVPDVTHPEDRAADRTAMAEMREGKRKTFHTEKRYLRPDGEPVWVRLHAGVVLDDEGHPLYFVSQMEDITGRRQAEAALRANEERTRRILETAGDAFVAIDDAGRITAWNRQAELTFGWSADAVLGQPLEEILIPPDQREAHRRGLEHFLATGEGPVLGLRLELTALHQNGGEIPVELVIWALQDAECWSFNAFLRDVSERKAMEEELQRLALVDELTGLRNRRGFLAVAEPLIQVAERNRRDMALVYIDVDNMKQINDRCGHGGGDKALVQVADVLRGTFRESDIIARLGGDEFCVLLPDNDPVATVLIDRLEKRLRVPSADESAPVISLSVGVATYRWEEPCPIEALIDQADAAMYQMKNERRTLRRP
jgi:diguanylate cyclase